VTFKFHIPVLRHVYGYSINKICEVLGIQYATLSDVAGPNSRTTGRRRSLNYEDIDYKLHQITRPSTQLCILR